MGYGQLDNDVTDKSEENPEVTSLREENRRLYELVERLIASQESEQAHRKAIEAEMQEMKLALADQAAAARDEDGLPSSDGNLGQSVEQIVEGLGDSLESRLSAKIEGLESRIAALSEAQRAQPAASAGNPDDIANATWKLIAPLGEELERLSGQVAGLSEGRAKSNDPDADASGDEFASSAVPALESLLESLGQANDRLVATAQDTITREREDLREVLETRLSEVSKSMDELLTRQDDTQSQTLTLLRGLVDSHIGRLTTEWSSQIDGLKRAVDDLRLEQVSLLNAGSELPDGDAKAAGANGAGHDVTDGPENVVTGDFPAFQQTEDTPDEDGGEEDAAEEKAAASEKTGAMSPDLRREMQAMEVLSEPEAAEDDRELEASTAEEAEEEDALLTEPAEWRAENVDDDDAFDFTRNGVATEKPAVEDEDIEERSDGAEPGDRDAAKAASGEGREIDLRAYKDLRLTCRPEELEADSAKQTGKASGKSYENAPAEASLTRFVRLIRARKRSSPS